MVCSPRCAESTPEFQPPQDATAQTPKHEAPKGSWNQLTRGTQGVKGSIFSKQDGRHQAGDTGPLTSLSSQEDAPKKPQTWREGGEAEAPSTPLALISKSNEARPLPPQEAP